MSRLALAIPLLLVAACNGADASANEQAAAGGNSAAPAAAPQGDVSAAEAKVRERLGNPQGLTFANARRGASEGVPIICGDYAQSGQRHRYIVVDGEEVFVEPQMEPGEMDRAFAEFCADGRG